LTLVNTSVADFSWGKTGHPLEKIRFGKDRKNDNSVQANKINT